jgi:hypothetical protein
LPDSANIRPPVALTACDEIEIEPLHDQFELTKEAGELNGTPRLQSSENTATKLGLNYLEIAF